MSTATEELGLRVTLTGNQQAASGLAQVAEAEKKVADAAATLNDAHGKSAVAAQKSGVAHDFLTGQLAQLRGAVVGALSIGALTGLIVAQTKAVYDHTAAFERYGRTLAFATGNQAGASAEMAFARKTATSLGLDIGTLTQQYGRLAAATQGSSLAGQQQRELMVGMAQAAAVLGLTNEQVGNSMTALTQIVSKGVVMSEELKGQLAESLPGALQIAARAMGKTTAELQGMLETGSLTANEFLPKFAAELKKTFGPEAAKGADNLTGAVNGLTNAITQAQLKIGEGGLGRMMAAGINQVTAAINGIPQDRIDRMLNSLKQIGELKWWQQNTLWYALASSDGSRLGFSGDRDALGGMQTDLRERLRTLPAYAGTDAQNQQLAESKQIYRDLIDLIEKRGATSETVARRIKEAEGKIQEALKATSALDNRAAARAAEPEGYYRNNAAVGAVANDAQALYLKYMAPATKLTEDYAAAVGVLRTALDNGVISQQRYSEASAELTRTTMLALNASTLRTNQAYTDRSAQRWQNEIDLEKAALETRRAMEKAAYDEAFVDRTTHAQRMAALDQQAVDLEARQGSLSLATLKAKRAEWERLEGQYLTVNERLAKGYEWDQKELEIKGRIAVTEQRRADISIGLRKNLYDAAKAEFDLLNQIDAASKSYTDGLKQQREDQQMQLGLLGLTATQQKVATAQYEIQKGLQAELNRLIKEENDLRDKGLLSTEAKARIDAAKDAAINAANAQKDWTAQVIKTQDAYASLSSTVDGFLDAAMKGFGALKDWLKNQFFDFIKSQVLKPLIMQIVVSATGGVTGGGAVGNSLLGSLGSSLLGSGGLLGGGGGLLGLGSLGGVMGLGSGVGILGTLGAGMNLAMTGLMGGGLSGLMGGVGLAFSSGLTAGLGSLIPIVGPIIALAALAKSLDPSKGQGMRAAWGPDQADLGGGRHTAFGWFDMHGDAPDQKGPWLDIIAKLDETFAARMTAAQIASATALMGTGRGAWHDYENGNASGSIGTVSKELMQTRFDAIFQTLNFTVLQEKLKGFTGTAEELAKWLATVGGMMQVLDDQAALVKATVGEVFNVDQLAALAKEGETLDATFTRVMTTFQATNGIAALLGKNVADAFGAVGLASLDARQNLVDLAGGISQLDQMSTYYYEHFYSESERTERQRAAALEAVNQTFATLNLTVPASRDEFRKLVEGLDLSTEAGRKMFVALMQVAPAFDLVTSAAAAATTAVARSNDYLNNFFSAEERAQMQRADAQNLVNKTFADLNLTVPQTRDEFRRLVEGLDLNTEAGRKVWNALMAIAGAFATVTDAANASAAAVVNLGVGITEAMESGTQQAAARLQQMATIIDAGQEDLPTRLARKMAAAASLAADYDRQYNQRLIDTGGIVDSVAVALDTARGAMQAAASGFAGDLAAYTSLAAQYGAAKAEKLLQLEQWHRAQLTLAGNNAQMLLAIEQSYQAQRTQILNDATSTGLASLASTVQQWLNNLLLNNQLTSLTPEAQLTEARNQMLAAYSAGNGSDFTRAADAYLGLARNAYASSDAYQQIFAWVQAMARSLISGSTAPVNAPTGTGNGVSGSPGNPAGLGSASPGATDGLLTAQAQLLAEVKAAIIDDGAQTRDNATANADRIVAATSPAVGETRVAV